MTQPNPFTAAEHSLIGDIYTSTTLWPTIQTLCDDFNGRFVGSDDERRAADYIAGTLDGYGLSDVHIERFPVHGWQRGPAKLIVGGHALDCIGLPGTPPCNLDAPIINIGQGEPADFARVGTDAKGKIALVHGVGSHRLEKYFRAVQAGCVGFIFGGAELGCLPPTGSIEFGGAPAPIPGVGVSHETLLRLTRMADGRLIVSHAQTQLQIKAKQFPAKGCNVIGDIWPVAVETQNLASPLPPPMLMLCAHYDGHDIAQGAIDNASGTTAVIEAARALMQVRDQLNIGIRVALWSGEETGMNGSAAYADAHQAELKHIKFVFNCDIVSNPGGLWLGINGIDTDRLARFLRDLSEMQVHALQISGNEVIVPYSDHFSFYLKGVPALMAATPHGDPKHHGMGPHTYGDTLDKVDVHGLRTSTAFVARTMLHLAHDQKPLPTRHATKKEVQAALRTANYEPLLKAQGRWRF